MATTPESLRRDLADGAAASQRADSSAEQIRAAAAQRRAVVQQRIDELVPLVQRSPSAADEYQALVAERGRLDIVLAGGAEANT